jgi:hypothetical protein
MDYMHQISRAPLLPIFAALLAASGPSWTSKPLQQWNEEDAKQILADSPWVLTSARKQCARVAGWAAAKAWT